MRKERKLEEVEEGEKRENVVAPSTELEANSCVKAAFSFASSRLLLILAATSSRKRTLWRLLLLLVLLLLLLLLLLIFASPMHSLWVLRAWTPAVRSITLNSTANVVFWTQRAQSSLSGKNVGVEMSHAKFRCEVNRWSVPFWSLRACPRGCLCPLIVLTIS
jgi:hypothetical protein